MYCTYSFIEEKGDGNSYLESNLQPYHDKSRVYQPFKEGFHTLEVFYSLVPQFEELYPLGHHIIKLISS